VGVSWYTWLEQGRDIQVSEGMLERLSEALRLDHLERSHLFELAQGRSPRNAAVSTEVISETLQHTIDAHPHPVVVTTTRWDVIALNRPAFALWGDRRGVNSLWFFFTDTAPRGPDAETHARNMVARFRYEAGRAADRAPFDQLANELAECSQEFRELWEAHELFATPEGSKVVHHPTVGDIELEHVILLHVEPDGRTLRVTLYTPRPGTSTERARSVYSTSS
jgi:hypothetical protein